MPLPHYRATRERKPESNMEEVEVSTSNEVAQENEKKVKSLAEHMISNILSNEVNYSISKHRIHKDGAKREEVSLEAQENKSEVDLIEYVYELTYDNSDYDKGIEENVRLTVTPDSFRIRTNNNGLVKQNSTIFSTIENELSHAYSVYYASKISKALDDAMTKVGNARKYAINQYLEESDETDIAKAMNSNNQYLGKKLYKSSMAHNTMDDEYYDEEEGI